MQVCDSGTLDDLKPVELLEYSNHGKVCLNEARKTFNKHYAQSTFLFTGPLIDDEKDAIKLSQNRKMVVVFHKQLILDLLYTFGSSITSITINFEEINAEDGTLIVDYINDRCSMQLVKLNLKNCKGNVLDGLNSEFTNVYSLTFSSSCSHKFRFSSANHSYKKIFRNIQILHLDHTTRTDWTFFDDYSPKLTCVTIILSPWMWKNGVDDTQVRSFLQKNEHINQLTLTNANLKILKIASQHLSRLTHLTLINLAKGFANYHGIPIHFPKVMNFILDVDHPDHIPIQIFFDQLEMFDLNLYPLNFNDKWTQFLANQLNPNLTCLTIDVSKLNKEQFLSIATNFPRLHIVDISCASKLTADDVVGFIKRSKSMIKLDLEILMIDSEQIRLKNILSDKWNIEYEIQTDTKTMISLHR